MCITINEMKEIVKGTENRRILQALGITAII